MPKENHAMSASSSMVRVSPYPLRSSRTNKHKASEWPIASHEWEDVRCVICMEPPHNAVRLTCSFFSSGCRPYMCDTSVRHSNCFKSFQKNIRNNHLGPKTLHCPLCRGEVSQTTKVMKTARRFMNAKPRSCPVDNCEFLGTYTQLNKHSKTEHRGHIPRKVDPQRQSRWDMFERHTAYVDIMTAAGNPHTTEMVPQQLPSNHHHPHVLQVIVDGTVWNIIDSSQGRSGSGPANYVAMRFQTLGVYRGGIP
ncbi:PREDICTED: uncharacterized protein LOC104752241 [Camelina sativa]|uniref:Uncharacterized protein LOC104752238 n=1 Tax=Camelina sativa TaxID=90675 RepID=A0ABM0WL37_CAMSA|nr:PREDICTED: uncharacterized protein LOC104752238 [Camelina sativa]XP_010472630.1 PREDICTED: uncharacterized protein LOC104752239 [Camelina sativa]XP_010472631.1 PREDICTED: uncharacterized protein LOC104752241 [Camelina sativa]